jgi:hypothetical protein
MLHRKSGAIHVLATRGAVKKLRWSPSSKATGTVGLNQSLQLKLSARSVQWIVEPLCANWMN